VSEGGRRHRAHLPGAVDGEGVPQTARGGAAGSQQQRPLPGGLGRGQRERGASAAGAAVDQHVTAGEETVHRLPLGAVELPRPAVAVEWARSGGSSSLPSSALCPPPSDSELAAMSTSTTARMPRAQRRAQLLELATRMFTEHGFQATSLDHIAAAAGVTKPVLYQHFESKETLYIEVLDLIAAGMIDEVRAIGEV